MADTSHNASVDASLDASPDAACQDLHITLAWIDVRGDAASRELTLPGLAPGIRLDQLLADALLRPYLGAPPERVVAVFGRVCAPDYVVREADRLEILPPLLVDPMTARRRRVEVKRRALLRQRSQPSRPV